MLLNFRIDFGYQYLYSRKHYHPVYIWDGTLECKCGEIINSYLLEYPYLWFGPGRSAKETKLDSPSWEITTKREFAGVRFEAEVNNDTVFNIKTRSCNLIFSAAEIIDKGRLDFSIGPKYLNCSVIVTKTDFLWFRQNLKENETEYKANQLNLQVHDWSRMKLAWLKPDESAKWEYDVKESNKDYSETLMHIVAMAVPHYNSGEESSVKGYIPLELLCDGEKILEFKRYYRFHDKYMQILEDDWKRFSVPVGKHKFELKNLHQELCLGISRITMKSCEYNHGDLSIPSWALVSEEITGKVFAVREDNIKINELGRIEKCQPGWNEFKFRIKEPGVSIISTDKSSAAIEIYDCEEEKFPVKVGYDMTTIPHDNNGFMDWLLDYTSRTRLGNYVVFRNFNDPISDIGEYERYGKFCRNHNIYVSICREQMNANLKDSAKEMFNDCGTHEYSHVLYANDPKEPYASENMKEASEKYIAYLKKEIDKTRLVSDCVAFGDASGGIRYSFLAGVDFVRAETMVAHTMSLLSQTRPAAEALGKGRWGVHIAIQHCFTPYHETHLGQYFLSLMQPWMMGAEVIYEEDSLFNLFKEERQAWDDFLTKGKRDMTRRFFKFVKTHPRKGQNIRKIAYLEGRYAAPFNGFICDCEQDPHYSVWGSFGNKSKNWGHKQPEKARQILDVLMPGASTLPLRQKFDKRRFYFSGTPYGEFDCVPIEADTKYLYGYKLILNLGWNTATEEDCSKLKCYIENGGVLLTGIPQFSTHIEREFLSDMNDLSLIDNKTIRDICGIKVIGAGTEYSGVWNCIDREKMPEPELSSLPNDYSEEDGLALLADIELCGAEIVAWDASNGKPMLVKHNLGKGCVYTLTLWAYPGHEKFQRFSASWVSKLSQDTLNGIYVKDETRDVFWSIWDDNGRKKVMLINTDWTKKGNVKNAVLYVDEKRIDLSVPERTLIIVDVNDNLKIQEFTL